MKKKLFIILMIFLLTILTVNTGTQALAEEHISLNKALKLVIKNDIEIEIASLELKNALLNRKKQKMNNLLTESEIIKLRTDLNVFQIKQNYLSIKNRRLINTAEKYFHLIELEMEKKIREKEVDYESKVLQNIRAEVKTGYKKTPDLFAQKNKYSNSLIAKEEVINDYRQELNKFKDILGITDEKKLLPIIIDNISVNNDLEDIDYKKIVNKKEQLKLLEKKISITAKELKKAKITNKPKIEINELENNLRLAELERKKNYQDFLHLLQDQHYIYKKSIDNIEMRKDNLAELKNNLNIIKEQYKKGMVKESDLLKTEINLLKGKKAYLTSVHNYYLSLMRLKDAMGREIGVDFHEEQI